MKKLTLILSVFVLIFGSLAVGYCYDVDNETNYPSPPMVIDRDQIPYSNSAINKLERGVMNMATCWAELPAEVAKVSIEQDPAVGATIGVVNGVITSAIRGLAGIYDTVTFPIPSYTKPAMKPEYALRTADDKLRALLW
ncbi:MAG: exosortase system-associated protein, TIGR04073 family [Candidatus Omnitrophica bacterium]|nr:exosortase system-associated protein, TIGR04073 family [Candidatus Omnitrophota bacterium]